MSKLPVFAALLVAGLTLQSSAHADVSYHFAEASGAGNFTNGLFGDTLRNPVTLDFSLAAPLGANSSYDFGFANIDTSLPNKVLSFQVSDGTAVTTLGSAVFPTVFADYGPLDRTIARFHLQTNADAALVAYTIELNGKPSNDTGHAFYFKLTKATPTSDNNIVMALFSAQTFGSVAGLSCGGVTCAGGFGPAAPVPEPASWALLLAGCAMVGSTVRRRSQG